MQQFNTHPRGITLMEVLISMGILAVGLASVVALVPAGGSQARLAMIDNTSINVGSAAIADLVNRGGLNPDNWQPAQATPYSVAIEPLGVDTFPSGLTKVALTNIANGSTDAETVFRWKDDLLYVLPDPDEGQPPTPMYDGSAIMHEGNFSWLATIQEDPNDDQRCSVSIVTFYRRISSQDLVYDLPSGSNLPRPLPVSSPNGLNAVTVAGFTLKPADFRKAFPRDAIMLFSDGTNHAWRRVSMATPNSVNLVTGGELLLGEDLPFTPTQLYVYPGAIALTEFTIAIEEMSPWSS